MGSGKNWTGEATPDSLLLIYCRTSLGLFSNLRHSSYHLSSFLGETGGAGTTEFAAAAGTLQVSNP